jgi:hypothetical protein
MGTVQERWGAEHFRRAPVASLQGLPLTRADQDELATVGLPVGPPSALEFNLRFETVDLRHNPDSIVALASAAGFEKGPQFPKTGDPAVDSIVDLSACVVLGEVVGRAGGRPSARRFVCLDGSTGRVLWIFAKAMEGRTQALLVNSSLSRYLESLYTYKAFRAAASGLAESFGAGVPLGENAAYVAQAKALHAALVKRLEAADRLACRVGFWGTQVANEAILMGIA